MKTATELFNEYFRGTDYEGQFEDAIAEHDKEIKDLIDGMVKAMGGTAWYSSNKIVEALTELKERLK